MNGPIAALIVSSSFAPGASMPASVGRGAPVVLSWSGVPRDAKSIAVIVEDVDVPGPSPFVHWLVYDVPAHARALDAVTLAASKQGMSSNGVIGFAAPRPPPGERHRYKWQVFALDSVPRFAVAPVARDGLVSAMRGHIVAAGALVGTYARAMGDAGAFVEGPCRRCIVLPTDTTASDVARRVTGDPSRWPELVEVNPQKQRSPIAGFDFLADGERLNLPTTWPDDPHASQAVYPESRAPRRFEAGSLSPVTLPQGWTDDDLRAVIVMASNLGFGDPRSLLYVWASETGNSAAQQLNPRTNLQMATRDPWSPFFAGGLNGSTAAVCRMMGFKSANDWLTAPIKVQLQGILRQYRNHVSAMGEGFDARASRIGTTPAALLYAFNFLPAYARGLTTPTQSIASAGSIWYDGNKVLDTSTPKKGYICLRDFEKLTGPNRWPSGWPVYALARRLNAIHGDPQEIAALGPTGAGIWDSIQQAWSTLTGKNVHDTAPIAATPTWNPHPPSVPLARHRWGRTDWWQATGVVLAAGLLYAHHAGWLRKG